MSAAFRISHRDERRSGRNGRRQCAIYNFYSAHMSAEIVTRAWASATRQFAKFYEASPTSAWTFALPRWINVLWTISEYKCRCLIHYSFIHIIYIVSVFCNKNILIKQCRTSKNLNFFQKSYLYKRWENRGFLINIMEASECFSTAHLSRHELMYSTRLNK